MPLNHSSQFSELTDDQYTAIGKIVVEWANIEELLSVLLGRLLATPEFLARTFTYPLSALRLQEAIQEAVEIHRVRFAQRLVPEDLLDEILRINSSVTLLRAARNKIAHFCWCRTSDESLFGINFAGGIPTAKSERKNAVVLTLPELRELHARAFSIVEQLVAVTARLPRVDEDLLFSVFSASQNAIKPPVPSIR